MDLIERIQFVQNILSKYVMSKSMAELDAVSSYFENPRPVISVVGAKCSGKCSLVNSLVGEDILPVSIFKPGLYYQVSIDNADSIQYLKRNGDSLPLHSISEIGNCVRKEYDGTVAVKRNRFPLLSSVDIKTGYDLNNGSSDESYLNSDIVILCVNASQPFGIKDMNALEKIVQSGHKRVIVCMTHSNCIKKTEVEEREQYLQQKKIPFPIYYYDNDQNHSIPDQLKGKYGADVIREKVESFISEGLIQERRLIVEQLVNAISASCIDELNERKLMIEKKKAEKYQSFLNEQAKVNANRLGWEEIRVEYEIRQNKCLQTILADINKAKTKISDRLYASVITTSNPKEWWEKLFPLTIKSEIESLTSGIDDRIQNQLIKDFNWLNSELSYKYRQCISASTGSTREMKIEYKLDPNSVTFDNLRTARYVTMAGGAALATVMYFVVGPVGALASASAGIIGDKYINKSLDRQRGSLKNEVANAVDAIFLEITDKVPNRLNELYKEVLKSICEKEDIWVNENANKTFFCDEISLLEELEKEIKSLSNLS